ncbi:MAG: DNA/RNA non-specific endonuclease, partial [Bacteroidota bacterium]
TGSNGFSNTIAGGNIDVPSSFWKVILVLPNGSNDINRVTSSTRVIAVNMPNNQTLSSNWANYRTSVNSIESLTGLNLLENIPNSIENTLESRVDNGPTN